MLENQVQAFTSSQFGTIRGLEIDGEPWLVGKDIAVALGYTNPTKAIRDHVDDEDKKVGVQNVTPSIIDSLGRTQYPTFINESGLYSLILGSKLPQAKAFKHWVTSDVLPSIRKHGAYATPQTIENIISNPDFGIQLLQALKDEREAKQRLQAEAEENAPKVAFADSVSRSETTILIGQFAKLLTQNGYRIGQNQLFAWMRKNGYLSSQKGQNWNLPKQQYIDQGLFKVRETTVTGKDGTETIHMTPRLTGKGQQYFFSIFFDNDRKPLLEPVKVVHRKKALLS